MAHGISTGWSRFVKMSETHYGKKVRHGDPDIIEENHSIYPTRSKINDLKNTKHVLFFGDSFTYGHGVHSKHTISRIIEKEYINDENYTVINFGWPGSSNEYALLLLHKWLLEEYNDNLHTIVFGFSGLLRKDNWIFDDYRCFTEDPVSIYNSLSHHSPLLPGMVIPEHISRIQKTQKKRQDIFYEHFAEPLDILINYEKILCELFYITKSLNCNLLLWHASHNSKFFHQEDYNELGEIYKNMSRSINMKMVDSSHALPGIPLDEKLPDGHLNPAGNSRLANIIWENGLRDFIKS